MMPWTLALLIGLLQLSTAASTNADEGVVYVIRHGEKKWLLGCLSDQGQARANNLLDVFSGHASSEHEAFAVPKAVFANRYADLIDCERCLETGTPIAEHLNLTVNHRFGYNMFWAGGNRKAAAAVKEALQATGGPVLVVWEHINIQHVTRHLGVERENVPKWEHHDYDTIYELRFNATLDLVSFRVAAQNFSQAGHRRLAPAELAQIAQGGTGAGDLFV